MRLMDGGFEVSIGGGGEVDRLYRAATGNSHPSRGGVLVYKLAQNV